MRVDCLDAADGQHVARGRARELVGAVAGADGDGQRVELGGLDELGRFFRVGQHLAVVQLANGANAVFLARLAGLQRAQAAQLALDGGADPVRHGDHLARHVHVVGEVGRGLAVLAQRAVHHHRAEAQVERALADGGRGAVVLVHDQRDVRVGLAGGSDQVLDEALARVLARACAGLQDHGRAHFVGRGHDGLHLLQVVDVEGGDAIAGFGGMVEQFAHRDERHGGESGRGLRKSGGNRLVTLDSRACPIRARQRRSALQGLTPRGRSSACWCRRAGPWARRR